ncbi:MAG TPA: phage portal protein [Corynebacterium glutamicum]|nr:phage portal protein [Corynebacterium glutamicum]
MGLFDFFRRTVSTHELALAMEDSEMVFSGPIFAKLAEDVDNMSVGDIWRSQPHLRTVTTYIAEQISSVGIHVYRREADDGRTRVRGNDENYEAASFARLMGKANSDELMQSFLEATILDFLLHDEFIWVAQPEGLEPARLDRVSPSSVVSHKWETETRLKHLDFARIDGVVVRASGDQIIRSHGYSPDSKRYGVSPVDSLRSTLKEQLEAASYRAQLWKSGARLGGVINRPADAKWDDKARRRFKAGWQSQYSGRGSEAGGTPVLEDGMTYTPHHLTAKDEQIVEMATLSLKTVAQVYHVNPTMVGVLEATNYSNVKEFRKSLFVDTLGPLIGRIEGVINHFLKDVLDVPDDVYAEFNVEQKLRGSFEEQAEIMTKSVGGPWMSVNEGRARMNLPAVEGGDEIIRPLNVGVVSDSPEAEVEEGSSE